MDMIFEIFVSAPSEKRQPYIFLLCMYVTVKRNSGIILYTSKLFSNVKYLDIFQQKTLYFRPWGLPNCQKMKLAFVFLTILLCCSLVNSVPDCPDGQHRCSNGECHDCCGDVHCQFGGASCGCTICRDYHCQPKCNPVAGWHCCNVDGQADCKKCCDDSDCPIGAECT